MSDGIEQRVTAVLEQMNKRGGYLSSLVCTDEGLLVAVEGSTALASNDLAAFSCLFDTVVARARLNLGFSGVDELTVVESDGVRLVVRPLALRGTPRMFLVVRLGRSASWRRNTTWACARLVELLAPLSRELSDVERMAY